MTIEEIAAAFDAQILYTYDTPRVEGSDRSAQVAAREER